MTLRVVLRETDIARRETGIVSWLGFREHITGEELAALFGEWSTGPYAYSTHMLTELAIGNLVKHGIVRAVELGFQGLGFNTYGLADQSAADNVDPQTVELAPREMVLLGFMDIRRGEAQTAAELDGGLRQQTELDSGRTEACLGHLAKLGLLQAVDNPPGAYRLPQ